MSTLYKIASTHYRICNHYKMLKRAYRPLMLRNQVAHYSASGKKDDSDRPTITLYDERKFSHNLPSNQVEVYFEVLPNIPAGVFRCTQGEVLGLGAGKCCMYKNPEYFSFHHMTYYDMHMALRSYRMPSAKTGRKP